MTAPVPLLEREEELATIAGALGAAALGAGGLLVIEGEAGAGKTALLASAARQAAEAEMLVLRARGGEYERDFPYGVVRQLFEPVLADGERRRELLSGMAEMSAPVFEPGIGEGERSGLEHGLHWLLADLAAAAPLALLVDDAQWADLPSLRALVYCARRLEDQPALLVLTVRTGAEGEHAGPLAELRREAGTRPIVPRPLSATAAAELLGRSLGEPPGPGLAEACREATGGNPLFLAELLRGLDPGDLEAGASSSGRLAELAAEGLSVSILGRLGQLGENATEVARAVAVLEPNAEVRHVASLSGLAGGAVPEACGCLISAQLLADARPLGFVHPLVRAAVLGAVPAPELAALHARAARLLAADGADDDSVAAQLLLSEPAGDEWVVGELRGAATLALARGAPDAAVRYLRRALREPPRRGERGAVSAELGVALLRASDPEGLDVLRTVRADSEDPTLRAELAALMANSLGLRVGVGEAAALLEESMAEVGAVEGPLAAQLRAHMLQMVILGLEHIPDGLLPGPDEDLRPDSVHERMVMQQAGLLLVAGAGALERGRALVEAAVAEPDWIVADSMLGFPPQSASVALALADRGDLTDDLCTIGIEGAERRGTVPGIPGNHGIRARCRYLDGRLRDAEADAEIAIRLLDHLDFASTSAIHLSAGIETLIARGDLTGAERLADSWSDADPAPGVPAALMLCARGELRLETGRHAEARNDFLAAGSRLSALPDANPEIFAWRAGLARSEAALGDSEAAQAAAAELVEQARGLGGRRAVGVALLTQGEVAGGEEAIELLRLAVAELAGTRSRLQLARSLVALGAALRRNNRRREARDPLREGLDLAHRCGAEALEEHARTELAATGARPRKAVLSGADSLTPSELRVARMAAEGMTNREIAQALFVTPKTVETHLRHVYRKLDVPGRSALPATLGAEVSNSRF